MRFSLCFLLLSFARPLGAADLPPGFIEIPLATGLDPTAMAQAPDGRIFIAEKYGAVRIVENEVLLPDPFVQLAVDNFNERGLSGIAFDPDFEQNGWVYLYYTAASAGHNRLSRVMALGNYAVPGSEEILLELEPLAGSVHNAGAICFGPDGKLYLATGDGSDGLKARAMNSLLGKILRLNADGSIPEDNPFYQQHAGVYRAIYASGFRNPFSMAIQPGAGRIFVCDVGSSFFEEINGVLAGMDYGWNLLEGKRSNQPVPPNYRDPLYAYSHNIGCAVTGAAFYNPPVAQFPAQYAGKFFFSDYCNKKIYVLHPQTGLVEGAFAGNINRPLALLTGLNGELYYLARGGIGGGSEDDNTSSGNGVLWRVSYVGTGAPVFSVQPANVLIPAGEDAVFAAQANGTPVIEYQWQRDGQDIPGAGSAGLTLPMATLADSGAAIRCRASNAFGQVFSQSAVLRVTANRRPVPLIQAPPAGHTYAAGDTIWFSGQATDPETGLLSAGELRWRIDLHHAQHAHPGIGPLEGVSNGTYVVPRIGETDDNVWLRIYLTARDQAGLSQTVYRDIFPQKTKIRLESTPGGLPMRIDGKTVVTPAEVNSVQGMYRQIQAQPSFEYPNTLQIFAGWADSVQEADRLERAENDMQAFRAVYRDVPLTGSGLYGTYFTLNPDTTFGPAVFSRIDTAVNFSWALGSPGAGAPADKFGVRWTGYIDAFFTEMHYFHVDSDDGYRLWVNGELVADAWLPKSAGERTTPVFLEKGKRYALQLDYFEWDGEASARLLWSGPSTPKRTVPKLRLFPRLPDNPGVAGSRFEVRLAPNPVRHLLGLQIDAEFQTSFDLYIFDANGRQVRVWRGQLLEIFDQQLYWPVSDLPSGHYRVQLVRKREPPVVLAFFKW